jgi:hypothetical protein
LEIFFPKNEKKKSSKIVTIIQNSVILTKVLKMCLQPK